jgi:mRNA-degrading endonuclease RelE of RelBE toxin-antitoxin system
VPYVQSYFFAGLLLALASFVRQKASIKQHIVRSLLIIAGWPILILVAPEFIASSEKSVPADMSERLDPIFAELRDLGIKQHAELAEEERDRLSRVAKAGASGVTYFADSDDFREVLRRFWEESIPPEIYRQLNAARWRLSDDYEEDTGARFSRREPDWFIGFSAEFLKSIAGIDKSKRAKVLEALGRLSEAPTTPHGDTVKPLTGDLAGLWRYRIGDDRLIYMPNGKTKQVVLVSFGARGGIYE